MAVTPISFELSDPRFERDGVRLMTVQSAALGRRGDVSVYLPPGSLSPATTTLPIVILLHGVDGSHWSWFQQGGAHHTAHRLIHAGTIRPTVIACPSDGLWRDGSAYLDGPGGGVQTWIVRDVVAAVRRMLGRDAASTPLSVGGLSMGGYGALLMASSHPDQFAAVSVHSTITTIEELAPYLRTPFRPGDSDVERASVLHWMARNRHRLPAIRFDCGAEDPLLAANARLHGELAALGVPHTSRGVRPAAIKEQQGVDDVCPPIIPVVSSGGTCRTCRTLEGFQVPAGPMPLMTDPTRWPS